MDLTQKMSPEITASWLEGVGAVAARQHELAATTMINMAEMLQSYLPGGDPRQAFVLQMTVAEKVIEASVANARDLAALIQKSRDQAFSAVQGRIAASVGDRLSDPEARAKLADFVVSKIPPILAAIDKSGLPSFIGGKVHAELDQVEITSLTAGVLSEMVDRGHTQGLLDALLNGLEKLVSNTAAMQDLRQAIQGKLPSLFRLYSGEPVVMNKIIDATMALITEIRTNPAHPFRAELDARISSFSEKLRNSREFASQLDAFKHDLLERPESADFAKSAWNGLRAFLEQDAGSDDSQLRRQIEAMLVEAGGQFVPETSTRG